MFDGSSQQLGWESWWLFCSGWFANQMTAISGWLGGNKIISAIAVITQAWTVEPLISWGAFSLTCDLLVVRSMATHQGFWQVPSLIKLQRGTSPSATKMSLDFFSTASRKIILAGNQQPIRPFVHIFPVVLSYQLYSDWNIYIYSIYDGIHVVYIIHIVYVIILLCIPTIFGYM